MSDSPVRSQDSVRPASGPGLRRILLNTISCYGRNFVEIATLLVLTPFILETVGKQAYGLWALVSAWVGLLALVDLGLGIAVVKFVADARGRGDRDGVRALVGTIFWTYAGLGTVLFLLATLSLLFFNQLFDIPEARRTSARAALFLLATRSALCLPLGAFQGVLVGFQKANIANVYRTVALMLYFGSVLVLLGRFPDIRVLAAINLGLGILSTGAMLAHARATLPEVRLHPRWFDLSLIRHVFTHSMFFMIFQIAALVGTRIDSVLIQSMLNLELVAVYSIALGLATNAYLFCIQAARALTPVLAELHGAGESDRIRRVWQTGTKHSVAFAMPLLLGLAILADALIVAWTGPEYRLAAAALQWLALAMVLEVIHGNTINVLGMGTAHRFLAGALCTQQVLNVGLTVAITPALGIRGTAMATFAATLIVHLGFLQRKAGAIHGVRPIAFYRRTLLPSLLPSIALVLGLTMVLRVWTPETLFGVGALEACGALVFWLVYAMTGLDREERRAFVARVERALPTRIKQLSVLRIHAR